jgi:hypothetical protein
VVVRGFLAFVGRYGFAPFAWWRIAVGVAGLIAVVFFAADRQPVSTASTLNGSRPVELAVRAETVEVGFQNRFEAGRLDAQATQRALVALSTL